VTYQIHRRGQHAKKGRSGFSGPNTYVAVTVAPEGATVPYVLNSTVLAKRGIEIRYIGEGYAEHSGPRSMLAEAFRCANAYVSVRRANEVTK
jgi:hypothetical protein